MNFRRIAKGTNIWLFTLLVFPLFLFFLFLTLFTNQDSLFWSVSQFLSLLPGKLGTYFRVAFYHLAMRRCETESAILFGTIFSQRDTEIGGGVYIGPNCNIGLCKIEDNCTLGSNVHIMSGKQQHFFDDLQRPIREQGGQLERVVIGEDTWIGNGALVMSNIGKKCIVGAGSVVVDRIADYSIVVGNPARLVRKRK